MSDEPTIDPIEHGIDKDGYLRIKVHLSLGKWNLMGALAEAQLLVVNYFGQMAKAEAQKKGLVRPNGNMNQWK